MILDPVKKAYLYLHTSVFLWGFTAILGELITLREVPLVWFRMLITGLALLFLPQVRKHIFSLSAKQLLRLCGIGCLVAIHWVLFYGSIKFSNASVALSCLATTSFITSMMEPLLLRRRFKWYESMLGILIVPGVYLVIRYTGFPAIAIVMGLSSAFFAALFTILNKVEVDVHEPRTMTFVEMGSGFLFMSMVLPFYLYFFPEVPFLPVLGGQDIYYLLLLAIGCTLIPFVMALQALRQLSAFASTLTVNLEPVYGIILAILLLDQNKELNIYFYAGTAIILLAVFLHPTLKRIFDPREMLAGK